MAKVVFAQDTLTLKWPVLRDLVSAVAKAVPGTRFDLGMLKLGGKVGSGLALSVVPGSKTLLDRTWIISQDNITFSDGTIDLTGTNYSILITGKNVTFKNVAIIGCGRQGLRHSDPFLLRVADGGQLSLVQCTLECEAPQPHCLLVDTGGSCSVSSTRIYGGGVGSALKVCGGTASINKRSLLQGGVLVTSPQPANQPAAKLAAAAASGIQPLPGMQPDIFEQALLAAATAGPEPGSNATTDPPAPSQPAPAPPLKPGQIAPPPPAPNSIQIQTQSRLEIRNSEVLAGPVTCLALHGSGSHCLLDSCHIGGTCNYAVLASHNASLEMIGCDVSGVTAGITLSGGAKMHATKSQISAAILGVRVCMGATANLVGCTAISTGTPSGEPLPLPAPPKPGMQHDFLPAVPSPAEARGRGAAIMAKDCVFGAPGVQGWRAVAGGQVAIQEGLEDGMRPLQHLNYKLQ